MTKLAKRLLAVVMALAMISTALCLNVFAATKATVKHYDNVVSLGDSIAAGFSLPDYRAKAGDRYCIGKTRIEGSYPAIVADAVKAKKYTPLASPGFRSNEVRFLLCNDYESDFVTKKWVKTLSHIDENSYEGLKAQRPEYQNAVKNADLVMLDIGFNDTWLPVMGVIQDILYDGDPNNEVLQENKQGQTTGVNPSYTLDDLMTDLRIIFSVPKYSGEFVEQIGKIATLSDYTANYEAIVKRIYQLNPNATVVAVLNYNPFKDWEDVSWLAPIAQSLLYDRINAIKESYKQTYGSQYITVNVDNVEVRTTSASQAANDGWDPHPTAAGHQYIADQIIKALPSGGVHKRSTIRTLDLRNDVWGVYDVNGYLDTNYTGLARTPKNTWYVKEGVLDQTWSGKIVQDGHTFTVKYGKVTSNQYRDD